MVHSILTTKITTSEKCFTGVKFALSLGSRFPTASLMVMVELVFLTQTKRVHPRYFSTGEVNEVPMGLESPSEMRAQTSLRCLWGVSCALFVFFSFQQRAFRGSLYPHKSCGKIEVTVRRLNNARQHNEQTMCVARSSPLLPQFQCSNLFKKKFPNLSTQVSRSPLFRKRRSPIWCTTVKEKIMVADQLIAPVDPKGK